MASRDEKRAENEKVTNFVTEGGDWSLACNAIHHLDLTSWLSGQTLESLDCSSLSKEWRSSKRQGHFDILGTISAQYSDGLLGRYTSDDGDKKRVSKVHTTSTSWTIDVHNASAISNRGHCFSGIFDRQSQITTRLVERIIDNQAIFLPLMSEVSNTHKIFIQK